MPVLLATCQCCEERGALFAAQHIQRTFTSILPNACMHVSGVLRLARYVLCSCFLRTSCDVSKDIGIFGYSESRTHKQLSAFCVHAWCRLQGYKDFALVFPTMQASIQAAADIKTIASKHLHALVVFCALHFVLVVSVSTMHV